MGAGRGHRRQPRRPVRVGDAAGDAVGAIGGLGHLGAVVLRHGGDLDHLPRVRIAAADLVGVLQRRQGDVTGGDVEHDVHRVLAPVLGHLPAEAGAHAGKQRAEHERDRAGELLLRPAGSRRRTTAILPSSSTGMIRLASNVNEPTTATTFSSTAWRAQLAPSFGSPLLSQVMTCSGWPAMPPLSLMYFSYTSAAPGMFGYGGSCVFTGAVDHHLDRCAGRRARPVVVADPPAVVAAPPRRSSLRRRRRWSPRRPRRWSPRRRGGGRRRGRGARRLGVRAARGDEQRESQRARPSRRVRTRSVRGPSTKSTWNPPKSSCGCLFGVATRRAASSHRRVVSPRHRRATTKPADATATTGRAVPRARSLSGPTGLPRSPIRGSVLSPRT